MKFFKRTLITISILIMVLILAVAGLGLWVYKNPETAWNKVQHYILPADLKITWSKVDFDIEHLNGLNFLIELKFQKLKINKDNPFIDFPVDQLDLKTSVFPFEQSRKIILHDLIIAAPEDLLFSSGPSATTDSSNPFDQIQTIQNYIVKFFNLAQVENVDIKVKNFTVQNAENKPTHIKLELTKAQATQANSLSYATLVTLPSKMTLDSSGTISFSEQVQEKIRLNIKLNVNGEGLKLSQNIQGSLGESNEITSTGSFWFKNKTTSVQAQPQVHIKMQESGLNLSLDSKIEGLPITLVKIDEIHAQLQIPFEKNKTWSDQPSQFSFMTPLKILSPTQDDRRKLEKICQCEIPQMVKAEVSGPIWLSNFLLTAQDTQERPLLDFKFKIDDVSNTLFALTASGQIQMNKRSGEYLYKPSLNLDAQIISFKKMAQVLDNYKILIPSPLDVLDGKVQLKVNGPVTSQTEAYLFPLNVETTLKSSGQVVNLSLDSQINLPSHFKSAHVDAHLKIHDLQLELPPLSPTKGNPRVVSDRRILLKPPQPPTESSFKLTMNLEVSTDRPGGIRLLSEYFKPYLPLTINIKNSDGVKNSGSVKLETFDIEYLRRRVKVENMALRLSDKNDKLIYVDGRASVQQTEYKIFIDVHGLASQPNIVLTSEPDLPRSEIINVLIYDRTSDQLVSADVKTAGQVDAAMADKAIGLFGLWAFAATPIKSFSYNPSTKIYSAVVEISDGVTASIGTTWESATQLSVQKRVSRNWILAAAWTPADQNSGESTKLVLQWEKRIE